MSGEASLAEKLIGVEDRNDRFLTLLRGDRELDFAFSDVEQRVSWVSLSEDLATSLVVNDSVSAGDSSEYGFPVDNLVRILHGIRLAAIDGFLGHQYLLTSLSIPAGGEECLMCGGCRDGGKMKPISDFRFAHH